MTIHDPDPDLEVPADAAVVQSVDVPALDLTDVAVPADAMDRLRDAEDALRTFYDRVLEAEAELAQMTIRTDKADTELHLTQVRLVEHIRDSDALFRARTSELEQELINAHAEIHALHNTRTMRAVAIPRRIYAKLRSLVR